MPVYASAVRAAPNEGAGCFSRWIPLGAGACTGTAASYSTLLRAVQGIVVQLENRKRPLGASFVKTWLIDWLDRMNEWMLSAWKSRYLWALIDCYLIDIVT